MKLQFKVAILALIMILAAGMAFAEEGDESEAPEKEQHFIFIGINPIMWVFNWYQAEVSIPLSGIFEIAAQGSLWDLGGFASTFGLDVTGTVLITHFGGVFRVFPGQQARGFFFSGRVMMLKFIASESSIDVWDLALGVDLGVRFRWMLGGWGIIFQFYAGMERAITQESVGAILPIIPFLEYHLGVCF